MTHALVLTANSLKLTADKLRELRSIFENAQEPIWLGANESCEIHFTPKQPLSLIDRRAMAEKLRANLPGIDIAVVPLTNRRKKLLVTDMDSTVIQQECLDELAGEIGIKDKVAAITERAMRGEIAFEPALRERIALLRGVPLTLIETVLKKRITPTPGAKTLIATMKKHGAKAILVSGGFHIFTQSIARTLGFDADFANRLEVVDGKLTGHATEPLFGAHGKRAVLIEMREKYGLSPDDTLAIGDGANDVEMIEEAALSIAFHGKPVLIQAAGARLDYTDLTGALYLQGYRRDEFVTEPPNEVV